MFYTNKIPNYFQFHPRKRADRDILGNKSGWRMFYLTIWNKLSAFILKSKEITTILWIPTTPVTLQANFSRQLLTNLCNPENILHKISSWLSWQNPCLCRWWSKFEVKVGLVVKDANTLQRLLKRSTACFGGESCWQLVSAIRAVDCMW